MAALKNLPPCPDNLKPMLHYIKSAVEHDNRDSVVAYWLRYHAVQLGIRIDSKSKPAKTFIGGVMDNLESTKKSLKENEAVTNDMVAQAHIENYALKLFSWADAEDRAGHFDKNVIKAFYTAGLLFDVLAIWGETSEEVARQQKYAKWKAAYIHNCLKNGETPVPGPMVDNTNDLEDTSDNIGGGAFPNSMTTSVTGGSIASGRPNTIPNFGVAATYPGSASDSAGSSAFSPPKATLPVAPPRNTGGGAQTPSPSTERKAGYVTNPSGVQLSSEDMAKAQKHCKYAASALQFDDIPTATDLLEKALRLLKTGRED